MKLRVKFSKMGSARFLSHLELMAAIERTFRRAKVPLAFTEGFNPHPKISYGSALSVGIASKGEYLDLELKENIDPKVFVEEVNKKTPAGIRLLKAKEIKNKGKSLTALIDRAKYHASCPINNPIDNEKLKELISSFLKNHEIIVQRKTKKNIKEINIKDGIYSLEGNFTDNMLNLNYLVMSSSSGNVRPQEVWQTFTTFAHIEEAGFPQYIREDLYAYRDGSLYTPLELLEG